MWYHKVIPALGTAQNTVISPNFLMWKFFGKTQFSHSFGRMETVPFKKISIPGN